jgi:hypothetical protein
MRVKLHPFLPFLWVALGIACGDPDDEPTDYQSGPSVMGDAALPDAGGSTAPDAGGPPVGGGAVDAGLGPADAGSVAPGIDGGGVVSPGSDGGGVTSGDAGQEAGAGADAGTDAGGAGCLTYENFGKQFMTMYCTNCHMGLFASHFVQLDSLAGVQTNKAAIKVQAVTGTTMPQADPKPSDADRKRLGEWLDCGPN